MRNRILGLVSALVLAIIPAAGQATTESKAKPAAAGKATYAAPRTPDGSRPRDVLKRPDWLEEVQNQLR